MLRLELILTALLIAVFAYTFIVILRDKYVLKWFFDWGGQFDKDENQWFYQPIFGCQYCNAGQIALWFYITMWIFDNSFDGNLIEMISFVSMPIFIVHFISKIDYKLD